MYNLHVSHSSFDHEETGDQLTHNVEIYEGDILEGVIVYDFTVQEELGQPTRYRDESNQLATHYKQTSKFYMDDTDVETLETFGFNREYVEGLCLQSS